MGSQPVTEKTLSSFASSLYKESENAMLDHEKVAENQLLPSSIQGRSLKTLRAEQYNIEEYAGNGEL